VFELLILLLLVGAIALLVVPRLRGRRGAGSDWAPGTLLVTGVSPRPDGVTGEQFVTITGVINGPTVNEHVVYAQLTVDVDQWPSMGALMDVRYSPKNPDKWAFSQPTDTPPPYPPAPPPPPNPQPYT
jgi:hypothetical protein